MDQVQISRKSILATSRPASARQGGVALIVALILLLVITMVGLAAVNGTLLQQKMSANFYDRGLAFQSDEAALRQAEATLQSSAVAAPAGYPDCSPGSGNVCLANPFDDSHLPSGAIITVPAVAFDAGALKAAQPQYVIQYMGNFAVPVPKVKQISSCSGYLPCTGTQTADFYRITARSGDPAVVGGRASVMLQSVFRK